MLHISSLCQVSSRVVTLFFLLDYLFAFWRAFFFFFFCHVFISPTCHFLLVSMSVIYSFLLPLPSFSPFFVYVFFSSVFSFSPVLLTDIIRLQVAWCTRGCGTLQTVPETARLHDDQASSWLPCAHRLVAAPLVTLVGGRIFICLLWLMVVVVCVCVCVYACLGCSLFGFHVCVFLQGGGCCSTVFSVYVFVFCLFECCFFEGWRVPRCLQLS